MAGAIWEAEQQGDMLIIPLQVWGSWYSCAHKGSARAELLHGDGDLGRWASHCSRWTLAQATTDSVTDECIDYICVSLWWDHFWQCHVFSAAQLKAQGKSPNVSCPELQLAVAARSSFLELKARIWRPSSWAMHAGMCAEDPYNAPAVRVRRRHSDAYEKVCISFPNWTTCSFTSSQSSVPPFSRDRFIFLSI